MENIHTDVRVERVKQLRRKNGGKNWTSEFLFNPTTDSLNRHFKKWIVDCKENSHENYEGIKTFSVYAWFFPSSFVRLLVMLSFHWWQPNSHQFRRYDLVRLCNSEVNSLPNYNSSKFVHTMQDCKLLKVETKSSYYTRPIFESLCLKFQLAA